MPTFGARFQGSTCRLELDIFIRANARPPLPQSRLWPAPELVVALLVIRTNGYTGAFLFPSGLGLPWLICVGSHARDPINGLIIGIPVASIHVGLLLGGAIGVQLTNDARPI